MIDSFGNNVIFLDIPVNATTTLNEDGSYTIFINNKLPEEKRLKTYIHELKHIKRGDFYKSNVQEIELQAHDT